MARVTVEDCLEKVPNRFALTVLASRRARALSENRGTPLVECENKPAVTALREIAASGVRYVEDVDAAMREFIGEQRAKLQGSTGRDHTFIDAVSFGPIGAESDDESDDDVKELTADLASLGTESKNDDQDGELGGAETGTAAETDGAGADGGGEPAPEGTQVSDNLDELGDTAKEDPPGDLDGADDLDKPSST